MKKSKILLLSLFIISSINFNARAYENDEEKEVQISQRLTTYKGLGITLGLLSSLGISYRTFITEKIGIKGTGIGFYDQNRSFWSVGIQAMYVLSENRETKFYLLSGISNFSSKANTYYPVPMQSDSENIFIPRKEDNQLENYLSIGGGIGAEIGTLTPGITLAVEVPIVFTFRNMSLFSLYPIPQISLMYNF